jgi:hypothetical protein
MCAIVRLADLTAAAHENHTLVRVFSFLNLKMAKKFPLHPKNPERICWGCDKYCPSDSLNCGNGTDRTQHPVELFGEDWFDWGIDSAAKPPPANG